MLLYERATRKAAHARQRTLWPHVHAGGGSSRHAAASIGSDTGCADIKQSAERLVRAGSQRISHLIAGIGHGDAASHINAGNDIGGGDAANQGFRRHIPMQHPGIQHSVAIDARFLRESKCHRGRPSARFREVLPQPETFAPPRPIRASSFRPGPKTMRIRERAFSRFRRKLVGVRRDTCRHPI